MNSKKILEKGETERFQGKVNHKVALLFGVNFLGVLLLGGVSTILVLSINRAAEDIRTEHHESEMSDSIHINYHHFLLALHRAVIRQRPVPASVRNSYRAELERLLENEKGYHRMTPEQKVVEEIQRLSNELFRLSEQLGTFGAVHNIQRHRQHLIELEKFGTTIQGLVHGLSIAHQARMNILLEQNKNSMQWVLIFYITIFLLETALLIGSVVYFGKTIAQPLRWLSRAANEVAHGGFKKKAPVVSNDEIGLLANSFNVMVEQLADNEEKQRQLNIMEERERIAAELHDSIAQTLALLNMKLNEVQLATSVEPTRDKDSTINDMRKIVGDAYDEVRQAIYGLRAIKYEKGSFITGLTEFLNGYATMRNLSVELRIPEPEAIMLAPQAEVHLIRIIQESLTNVSKHAGTNSSVVTIDCDGDYAKVIIEDNGKGFIQDDTEYNSLHFGLKTMQERTKAAGGEFFVESALGQGTKVTIRLPLDTSDCNENDSSTSR